MYLPPEAFVPNQKCGEKFASFSFGIPIMRTLTGKPPILTDASVPDTNTPGKMIACPEVERRERYIN